MIELNSVKKSVEKTFYHSTSWVNFLSNMVCKKCRLSKLTHLKGKEQDMMLCVCNQWVHTEYSRLQVYFKLLFTYSDTLRTTPPFVSAEKNRSSIKVVMHSVGMVQLSPSPRLHIEQSLSIGGSYIEGGKQHLQ